LRYPHKSSQQFFLIILNFIIMKRLELVEMEGVAGGWSWNCTAAVASAIGACAGGALATAATSGVAVVAAVAGIASATAWVNDACL
jgi:hypothetical protein